MLQMPPTTTEIFATQTALDKMLLEKQKEEPASEKYPISATFEAIDRILSEPPKRNPWITLLFWFVIVSIGIGTCLYVYAAIVLIGNLK